MKKIIIILLFCLSLSALFSLGYSFENCTYAYLAFYDDLVNQDFQFSFNSGKFSINFPELDNGKNELGIYVSDTINSTYNLVLKNNFLYLEVADKTFLLLYYEDVVCALIDCETEVAYWGLNVQSDFVRLSKRIKENWIGISNVSKSFTTYSSVLQERINNELITYDGYSKYYLQIDTPWVPANNKKGVDEWIEKKIYHETNTLIFINGFVKANRQDLFYANSRIKKIEIRTEKGSWEFELEDIPNPQLVQLPMSVKGTIKVIIKEIYQGEKYFDTCLSAFNFLNKVP